MQATKTLSVPRESPERLLESAPSGDPATPAQPGPDSAVLEKLDAASTAITGLLTTFDPSLDTVSTTSTHQSARENFSSLFEGSLPQEIVERFVSHAETFGGELAVSPAWLTACAIVHYQQVHALSEGSFIKLARLASEELPITVDNGLSANVREIDRLICSSNLKMLRPTRESAAQFHEVIGAEFPDVHGNVETARKNFVAACHDFVNHRAVAELADHLFSTSLKPFENWRRDVLEFYRQTDDRETFIEECREFPATRDGLPAALVRTMERAGQIGLRAAIIENLPLREVLLVPIYPDSEPEMYIHNTPLEPAFKEYDQRRQRFAAKN